MDHKIENTWTESRANSNLGMTRFGQEAKWKEMNVSYRKGVRTLNLLHSLEPQ